MLQRSQPTLLRRLQATPGSRALVTSGDDAPAVPGHETPATSGVDALTMPGYFSYPRRKLSYRSGAMIIQRSQLSPAIQGDGP